MGAVVKYAGGMFEARSVGELHHMVLGLSSDGFRIVNVLDRSSPQYDRFIIVAQKDVDAHIHVVNDVDAHIHVVNVKGERPRLAADRDPSKNP